MLYCNPLHYVSWFWWLKILPLKNYPLYSTLPLLASLCPCTAKQDWHNPIKPVITSNILPLFCKDIPTALTLYHFIQAEVCNKIKGHTLKINITFPSFIYRTYILPLSWEEKTYYQKSFKRGIEDRKREGRNNLWLLPM